jgi:predicted HAD superfamily Cof-like phosphohydrolase
MAKWDVPVKQVESVSSMVKEFAEVTQQEPNPETYVTLIREEFVEWGDERYDHKYYDADNAKDELKELSDLVYVIYGYANARGWNLDEAIARVHRNNIGRCVQPDGTIKRREDGKITKNPDYPKVKLDDLV